MKGQLKLKVLLLIVIIFSFICIYITAYTDAPKTYNAEEIYEKAKNSVFYVRVFKSDGTLENVGTGFVVDKDGIAITAYHVTEGGDKIEGVFKDGKIVKKISIIASDKATDVTILKLPKQSKNKQYDSLSIRSEDVRYGEKIFAMGYPIKNTQIITEGIVNAPSANVNGRNIVLVSSQIASGMSGGPIIDQYANIVGVVSASMRTMNNIHIAVNSHDVNKLLGSAKQK